MSERRPCATCGHGPTDHRTGPCTIPRWVYDRACTCTGYVDLLLPKPGERLVFGYHRLPEAEAETAPAWPSLAAFGAAIRRRSLRR